MWLLLPAIQIFISDNFIVEFRMVTCFKQVLYGTWTGC